MGGGSSTSLRTDDRNVVFVTLYYTPLDPRCFDHLEQFCRLKEQYKIFSVFRCVNALANLNDVPSSIVRLPVYTIQRGQIVTTATPDGGLLEHSLRQLAL